MIDLGPVGYVTGRIGAAAGSTACSVKIFRYRILFSSIRVQPKRTACPHGIFRPDFDGRPVPPDMPGSVMAVFALFTAQVRRT